LIYCIFAVVLLTLQVIEFLLFCYFGKRTLVYFQNVAGNTDHQKSRTIGIIDVLFAIELLLFVTCR